MQKRVMFLTTAHKATDDRIYYHQAVTLKKQGYFVKIVSFAHVINEIRDGTELIGFSSDGISKFDKIKKLTEAAERFNPDLLICSEPLAVAAAAAYRKKVHNAKIIYDVTEWYPSKKSLGRLSSFPRKFLTGMYLLMFNLWAGLKADGYIFGEFYKQYPFKLLFFRKKHVLVSYYPDLSYINYKKRTLSGKKEIVLAYTGRISEEKGIGNFIDAVKCLRNKAPELKIGIKIIGWFSLPEDRAFYEKKAAELSGTDIVFEGGKDFLSFSEALHGADICFDLRRNDFENRYCLPIKIFYYAACGRPVIYTDLKALRRDVKVSDFGYLMNPKNACGIADLIMRYADSPALYAEHAKSGRLFAENEYNWENIKGDFLKFIEYFIGRASSF